MHANGGRGNTQHKQLYMPPVLAAGELFYVSIFAQSSQKALKTSADMTDGMSCGFYKAAKYELFANQTLQYLCSVCN